MLTYYYVALVTNICLYIHTYTVIKDTPQQFVLVSVLSFTVAIPIEAASEVAPLCRPFIHHSAILLKLHGNHTKSMTPRPVNIGTNSSKNRQKEHYQTVSSNALAQLPQGFWVMSWCCTHQLLNTHLKYI